MDFIFINGKIYTMNFDSFEEELAHLPEAVLVRDGRIQAVGALSDVREVAGPDVVMKDLGGRCLMPGFIDGHSHISLNGEMATWADLANCSSHAEIVEELRRFATEKKIDKNGVIVGFGYDHNFLAEKSHPEKTVLDLVSSEIPVFIMHVTGHFGCVNSAALEKVGFDEHTPDPKGGVIVRYPGSMEPTGYLEEMAMEEARRILIFSMEKDEDAIMEAMQETYIKNGITTVQDGETRAQDMHLLEKMNEANALKVDVISYPTMMDGGVKLLHEKEEYTHGYKGRLRIAGYKLVLDGSPQGRTAWMSKPYLNGEEGYCGFPWVSDEDVRKLLRTALKERRQVLAHCNGDAASEQFLSAYETVSRELGIEEDLRPVMIHCQTVRNDQLDRMARLNMIASIFVGHVWYWSDIHLVNFGPERGHHISPCADALKRGVKINFHQDTPITSPNMLHSVWCAVNRISRGGQIVGAEQKISAYSAFKAITIDAAYEYFEEKEKGSIEVGKRADLVILDRSPFEVDPTRIRDIKVWETIKDGVVIYKKEEL